MTASYQAPQLRGVCMARSRSSVAFGAHPLLGQRQLRQLLLLLGEPACESGDAVLSHGAVVGAGTHHSRRVGHFVARDFVRSGVVTAT